MLLKGYKHKLPNSLKTAATSGFAIALLATVSIPSFASGSGSGAWSNGNFHHGKQVFAKKLYCETCPLAGKALTRNYVSEIMPEITSSGSLGQNLSLRERQSVRQFLKTKFNL